MNERGQLSTRTARSGVLAFLLLAALGVAGWQTRRVFQLNEETRGLRATAAEVARLREENQQAQNASLANEEIERLRKDNEELHRLRNEVRQLREQKQEWQRQSSVTSSIPALGQSRVMPAAPTTPAAVLSAPAGRRAWLGLFLENIPPVTNADGSLVEERFGAIIRDVAEGGPGANAGLKGGDIVVALDGQSVLTSQELHSQIQLRQPGQTLTLDVVRNDSRLRFQVQAGERQHR